jgi:hypothetical protein
MPVLTWRSEAAAPPRPQVGQTVVGVGLPSLVAGLGGQADLQHLGLRCVPVSGLRSVWLTSAVDGAEGRRRARSAAHG